MPIIPLNKIEVFYGRERELKRLKEALEAGGPVVVTGPMGSGKTTLFKRFHAENPGNTSLIDMRCGSWNHQEPGLPGKIVMTRTMNWYLLIDHVSPDGSVLEGIRRMISADLKLALAVTYSQKVIGEIHDNFHEAEIIELKPFILRNFEEYLKIKAPEIRFTRDGIEYLHRLTGGNPLFTDCFLNVLSDGPIYGPSLLEAHFEAKFQQIGFRWLAEIQCLNGVKRGIISLLYRKSMDEDEIEEETGRDVRRELEELELAGFLVHDNGKWSVSGEFLKRILELLEKQTGCI